MRVFVDCEHFFDGYRENPAYALEAVRTAAEAGAEVVVLCDTNGGMLPPWVGEIVGAADRGRASTLGIHAHNDTGCAVANTLAAVDAGAMHVQGTVNGYGERTGNAELVSVVANLELKYGWPLLPAGSLREATRLAHAIAEVTNVPPSARQPYVGLSSFAHKAGLHASAIKVDPNLYQHIDPALVGNDMRMLVSDMAGRANIQIKGDGAGVRPVRPRPRGADHRPGEGRGSSGLHLRGGRRELRAAAASGARPAAGVLLRAVLARLHPVGPQRSSA